MSAEIESLYMLLVALAIGLMIGIERGWQERDSQEGQRIAGVRTYGLIGLLGGVLGMLAQTFEPLVLGLGFLALTLVIGSIFLIKQRQEGEWGITSLVAALLVFVLGALATSGKVTQASASAVVMVLLLSYKPQLHGLISKLRLEELRAGIKLLLISVVMLPVLPDQGYGPWEALNPYRIWMMVVLIAAISFIGYFAIKIGGAHRGILFTGLFGGLASSTAVTLHLSRLGKQNQEVAPVASSGILIACGTAYVRILIVVAMLAPSLLRDLWPPVVLMALVTYLPLILYRFAKSSSSLGTSSTLQNPLELKTALTFGAILTAVMLLSVLLREAYGDAGLLILAAVSGMADIDAMMLSLIGMTDNDLSTRLFVMGLVITAAANSMVKGVMTGLIGGRQLAIRTALPLVLAGVAGVLATWLGYW
ncbi:MgtC/SapB family protein [Methylophaga sp. OBS1]|uniref:MgtC/SapB family protein n=1 Tax=Methylophaga sp. OBS1 TaxID=2991933 RepID=UPI002259A6FB|nr:MgtC/SapB family protein [Methylophaga sp. OBS1]MCX4192457.1 MgtC/SapB family protein [Methylophaga sp. OBS1]